MSLDLLTLGATPLLFLVAWLGATRLIRSHQPIVGPNPRRATFWSVVGGLSVFWMILVLIVGMATQRG